MEYLQQLWKSVEDYLGPMTWPTIGVVWLGAGLFLHYGLGKHWRSYGVRRYKKNPLEMYRMFCRFSWLYEGHPLRLVGVYEHKELFVKDLPPECYYDYRAFFLRLIEEWITGVEGLNSKGEWLDKTSVSSGNGISSSPSSSSSVVCNKQVIKINYLAKHKVLDFLGSDYIGSVEFHPCDDGQSTELLWWSEWDNTLAGSILFPIAIFMHRFFNTAFWNILLTLQWSIDSIESKKQ